MATLTDIRKQYPQYNDMSDDQLAQAFHSKFYADMPFDAFAQKIGFTPKENPATSGTETYFDIPSMSFKQRPSSPFVAGVGESFVNTGRGIEQLALKAGNKLGLVSDQTVAQNQQDIDEARRLDAPLNATTGGKAGQFAGDAAMVAAAPEGLAGAMGSGAALAGAQPTSGDESRLINAGIGAAGGAAGYLGGKVVGKVIQPITDSLSAAGRWARQVLQREGVPLDAAQATGDKVVTTLKNAAGDAPMVGNSPFPEAQRQAFTQAALKQMGVGGATDASPSVMAAGKKALKDTYNNLASKTSIAPDAQLGMDVSKIRYEADRALTPENAKVIQNQLDDLETMTQNNGGKLSGDGYQQLQSALGKIAKDGGKAPFVTDIRQALTNALQRQSAPEDAAALAQTNQRYAAMKAIEKAIDDDNLVSPAKLYNAMDTAKGANQTVYGQGPNQRLADLAQAGKLLIGNTRTPNSGTAQRLLGDAAIGGGGVALWNLAQGKTQNAEEMLAVAAMAGLSGTAARQLVYSQGGRAWLQRWAQSRVAAAAARQAGRLSQTAGASLGPSITAGPQH